MTSPVTSNQTTQTGDRRTRLDSWKEIAAYLKRDPRTVRRWERHEGLPVHRHYHGKQGTVYAFVDAIDAWLERRRVAEGAGQLAAQPQRSARVGTETGKMGTTFPRIIAVLPLHNIGGDSEQEWFADGLTEELIMEIGRCCSNSLRVIALTSVVQYKQSTKSIAQIGQELGADYILEGAIRRHGRRVRLTARLIAARDQTHIWADSYEIQLPSIFSLQQEFAWRVANSLRAALHATPRTTPYKATTPSVAAHSAYIEGRSHFMLIEGESWKNRIEQLNLAIERDPKFAPSYAELALTYFRRLFLNFPPIVQLKRIEEFASKALKLDPTLALAHSMLAAYYLFGAWNWSKAEATTREAIKLNPSEVWARIIRTAYHVVVGEIPEAMQELEQAHQLTPRCTEHMVWFGLLGYVARRYDFAIERFRKVLELDPSVPLAHSYLGLCYAETGDYTLALSQCEMARELGNLTPADAAAICSIYAMAGERDSAESLLHDLVATREKEYVRYIFLALASTSLRKDEQALDWLEKACEQRDPLLIFLKAVPRYDPLSEYPRFRAILHRIGLPAERKRPATAAGSN